jgi:predicted nucleotidyltransferase
VVDPDQIALSGSSAWGETESASDIDGLILKKESLTELKNIQYNNYQIH